MVCAAINQEAHHRGQIAHWARQLGAPLGPEQQLLLWDWHKLWKDASKRSCRQPVIDFGAALAAASTGGGAAAPAHNASK
jgi:hypothetical protein